jgi:hypothetical protein
MGTGSTLIVNGDSLGAYGTQTLGLLDATAPSNTVIYLCNSFQAKRTDYYNLAFTNTTANNYDFYNGAIPGYAAAPMHIAGDMTLSGKVKVQQGADFNIDGSLTIATNSTWDCSSFKLIVAHDLTLGGLWLDLDGALGTNYIAGNVTVTSTALGWNVSDVTQWGVGGSVTNNGFIGNGKNYGSISFDGTGYISGKPFKLPTALFNGTYTIATTLTFTTNAPVMAGTLVFDLANTNRMVLQAYPDNPLTLSYAGFLNVINTGPASVSGKVYKFFDATNYDGGFFDVSYPALPPGLSWEDDFLTSGSIAVIGTVAAPTLSWSVNGNQLSLSWDSSTYPGFTVQAQTNQNGIGTVWGPTGSGTTSPVTFTINRASPPVFYRLFHP